MAAQIELVRGSMDAARQQELLSFWDRRGGPVGEEARRLLAEVVCLVRRDRNVVGVSSVFPAEVELVAGRRFLVFRCLLDDGLEGIYRELIRVTFDALDAEPSVSRAGAEGLCALLGPDVRRRYPEAEWDDPHMLYAGYLSDGRQVRIAYFSDQVSERETAQPDEGWRPHPGYEIAPFDEQTVVSAEDVIAIWVAAAGLTREQAEARVSEVLLVASDSEHRLVGMCTVYLKPNEQLQAELWHYRVFVLAAHRNSSVGISLTLGARDILEQRYRSGADRRGLGVLFEIEHEGLKRHFPKGRWRPHEFFFIGETALGAHVRVHYFPGVHAPEPAEAPPDPPG
jgi:hypothetical protein